MPDFTRESRRRSALSAPGLQILALKKDPTMAIKIATTFNPLNSVSDIIRRPVDYLRNQKISSTIPFGNPATMALKMPITNFERPTTPPSMSARSFLGPQNLRGKRRRSDQPLQTSFPSASKRATNSLPSAGHEPQNISHAPSTTKPKSLILSLAPPNFLSWKEPPHEISISLSRRKPPRIYSIPRARCPSRPDRDASGNVALPFTRPKTPSSSRRSEYRARTSPRRTHQGRSRVRPRLECLALAYEAEAQLRPAA